MATGIVLTKPVLDLGPEVRVTEGPLVELLSSWKRIDGKGLDASIEVFEKAYQAVIGVFDSLLKGMLMSGMVKGDNEKNLEKLVLAARRVGAGTVREMIQNEISSGVALRNSGREALLWMKRTLQFVRLIIRNAVAEGFEKGLASVTKSAYDKTLAPCHGLNARGFKFAMNGMPKKRVFFERLSSDTATVQNELSAWLYCSYPMISNLVVEFNNLQIENVMTCQQVV
ncbi:hypothetical protein NDN08_008221 [Rhodosorus marinus]|uniref:Glycolipid transfer protein domain-containing protein n=1 Tax=Rhodosorus marinus TaxID=101924 RepID=A0AAV8V4J5_9RHOD|nr:hypothetical protein NDN08_008221 [Rhodosorus marinus]